MTTRSSVWCVRSFEGRSSASRARRGSQTSSTSVSGMGGGDLDDEDPKRELERLERDLAAIDARWATEGYQQRTTSQVLDDERKTRRELARRIAALRGLPPPLTPAAGTVALNVGGAWRPLAVSEVQEEKPGETLPAFDVEGEPEVQPPPLADLERELHALMAQTWELTSPLIPSKTLGALTKRFFKTPGALRLLAAAWRAIGRPKMAESIPWVRPPVRDFPNELITHPLLTEATEFPDELTGLTATQTTLMEVLRVAAPESGRFVPASDVFSQVQGSHASIDLATFVREVALLGHPSLRRLPLVTFQGFTGRFTAEPTFTHVRLTQVGREVIDGAFPLPNLLLNGARGKGSCLLPMNPFELANCCLSQLEDRGRWPESARGFDPPDGATTSWMTPLLYRSLEHVWVCAKIEPQLNRTDQRCRVVVSALPWPRTFADVVASLSNLFAEGALEGATDIIDESSADRVRFSIEIEHIAFLRRIEQDLRRCGLFDARYAVEARAICADGEVRARSLTDIISAFIESRISAARERLDLDGWKLSVDMQNAEAVFVALQMIDRVQDVLRASLSDSEGEEALMNCMRAQDREVLERLPAPASHRYATGFTREQARYLARKRKLAAVPVDTARSDWLRALARMEDAKRVSVDDNQLFQIVRQEFRGAIERFANERRRFPPVA
ncbi:MAG: hypothetical protein JNM17_07645 [Archangium sp.]|nr:hypothetical protein [Archangium sp.]